jgi:hypothetical protein
MPAARIDAMLGFEVAVRHAALVGVGDGPHTCEKLEALLAVEGCR